MAKLMGVELNAIKDSSHSGVPYAGPDGGVMVDGVIIVQVETLLETEPFLETLLCLVLSFSVLNLSFPRKLNAFYSYIQLYLLGIDEGGRVPLKALSFKQQIAAAKMRR